MATDLGTGTTIAFGTSGWAANVVSIGDLGEERPSIDTTHLATSDARTYIPGNLRDGGTLTIEAQHDPSQLPPITAAAETITITFEDTSTCGFTGFCTSYKIGGITSDEALMTATVSIKVSGKLTWTAA